MPKLDMRTKQYWMLVLPKWVFQSLDSLAQRSGRTIDELINDAVIARYKITPDKEPRNG